MENNEENYTPLENGGAKEKSAPDNSGGFVIEEKAAPSTEKSKRRRRIQALNSVLQRTEQFRLRQGIQPLIQATRLSR